MQRGDFLPTLRLLRPGRTSQPGLAGSAYFGPIGTILFTVTNNLKTVGLLALLTALVWGLGYTFGGANGFRISFAADQAVLDEALRRITGALA